MDVLVIIMYILFVFGVFGLYRWQVQQAGILGLLGFLSTSLGFLFDAFTLIYYYLFVIPIARANVYNGYHSSAYHMYVQLSFFANGLFFIGAIILGISVIRAKVFSRTAGILMLAGGILNAVATPTSTSIAISAWIVIFGVLLVEVGLAWTGYTLLAQPSMYEVETSSLSPKPLS